MRKLLAAIVASLLFGTVTLAQTGKSYSHFGFKAGMNVSTFRTAVNYADFDPKLKTGMVLGAYVEIPVSKKVSIQPEFLYSQMGSKAYFTPVGTTNYKYNYFSIPLEVKYKCHDFAVFAGPQGDILISAHVKDYLGTHVVTNQIQDFDCGFTVGAEYWFDKHFSISARYIHGIRDSAVDDETHSLFNEGVQLNIGYKLFHHAKKTKAGKKTK